MSRWLRQSTAVDIGIGPFVDQTDGFTAETALTLSQADIRLKKNNGNWAQKNDTNAASHEENGWYEAALNTTDTDTLGVLLVAVNESGALPVWHEFMVLPQQVWDSLFGADKLQVHADEITAGLITAAAIADNAIDAGAIAADAITSTKIADNAITANKIASDAITAAKIAADAITAAKIAQNAIDADAIAADAITEIQAGLATSAAVAAVNADTDNIQTRLPAALVSGKMDAALDATGLAADAVAEIAAAISIPSAADVAEAVRQAVIEGALTMEEVLRIILAAAAGISDQPAAGQRGYRDVANSKYRITATVSQGDRSAVTLDGSA